MYQSSSFRRKVNGDFFLMAVPIKSFLTSGTKKKKNTLCLISRLRDEPLFSFVNLFANHFLVVTTVGRFLLFQEKEEVEIFLNGKFFR